MPLTRFDDPAVPTYERFLRFIEKRDTQPQMAAAANALAEHLRFFHWRLEFPTVFEKGGFDVVLGNPPWERPEFHEEQYWLDDPTIYKVRNKADRQRRLEEYRNGNDMAKLKKLAEFDTAKHASEAEIKYWRASQRFPLSTTGKFNMFALFAELDRDTLQRRGRSGIIVPTGIATDDTCKAFFATLTQNRELASLFDFENREYLFSTVDSRMRFALLTFSAAPINDPTLCFFVTRPDHIRDLRRHFSVTPDDLLLLNPNTRTCPVFRSSSDAQITRSIYRRIPILVNDHANRNTWEIHIRRIFNMGFADVVGHAKLNADMASCFVGDSRPPIVICANIEYLPIYEGKMFGVFNHRAAGVKAVSGNAQREAQPDPLGLRDLEDPGFLPMPSYWMPQVQFLKMECGDDWIVGYKDVTAGANERTMVASVLPTACCNYSIRCLFLPSHLRPLMPCLLANLNALVYDYVARQSLSGLHLAEYIVKQIPVLGPERYSAADLEFILPRVVELTYTAWTLPISRMNSRSDILTSS